MKKTILCVEDNKDTCDLISFVFQKAGYDVITCGIPEEGIRLARENDFAAIILDYRLNGIDGLDICRVIRTFDTAIPIIFFTAEAREANKQEAIKAGAQAYLIKPEDFERLEETVTGLINKDVITQPQEDKEETDFSFVASKNHRISEN